MPPMPDSVKASTRKVILDLLKACDLPCVEESASFCRIGLALALGGLMAKAIERFTEDKLAKVFIAIHAYLSQATDEEIVSLFREGTAASVN